ncbi:very-long-chain (3R)-3-hydroxyacyl-CoA dehydratase PASTICCINO 2 isoform X4 [Ziziphus jujuba]|uniref:Very-long-chain (3R)-3-hydroxyacyl-CoA dehydratase n=1 Tax=Ziziphus jujuba TaxID=326968 RepID=A0A6P6GES4_ZIZJJ|nr:very-long-chain (3R)-3-hydroxyacyl-CoA dehydratase PASTICCINO 2 isoform X4 [Ziziphus jujuba]
MAASALSVVLKRVYLAVYNWTVFTGWSLALYLALKTLKETGYGHVYKSVEKPLQLAQSAAVLEILHSLVGLVRSPITATLPQILGRLYITWGILWSFPGQTQTHILVSTLVFSWSITEVVRYSFFGTKEALGFAPSWLLWLRYSTFFLLHPIGVTSEIGLIYIALPDIKESEKYSIKMPNKWNFSFYFFYAAIFTIGIFSIGSFFMFQHLCRQRNKALSKPKIV